MHIYNLITFTRFPGSPHHIRRPLLVGIKWKCLCVCELNLIQMFTHYSVRWWSELRWTKPGRRLNALKHPEMCFSLRAHKNSPSTPCLGASNPPPHSRSRLPAPHGRPRGGRDRRGRDQRAHRPPRRGQGFSCQYSWQELLGGSFGGGSDWNPRLEGNPLGRRIQVGPNPTDEKGPRKTACPGRGEVRNIRQWQRWLPQCLTYRLKEDGCPLDISRLARHGLLDKTPQGRGVQFTGSKKSPVRSTRPRHTCVASQDLICALNKILRRAVLRFDRNLYTP